MIDCVVAFPGYHKYVPPPVDGVAVRIADAPSQIVGLFTETVGAEALTVTVDVAFVEPQPEIEYVTVYVDVAVGETVMEDVVSPPGDQRNVPPEVDGSAVNTVLEPEQMVGLFTVTDADEVTVMS